MAIVLSVVTHSTVNTTCFSRSGCGGNTVPIAIAADAPQVTSFLTESEGWFARLDQAIKDAGYLPMSGQIVDASLVAAPRQRTTAAEKEAIKAGKTAAEIWADKPARAAQKDTDARWTMKTAKGKPKPDSPT